MSRKKGWKVSWLMCTGRGDPADVTKKRVWIGERSLHYKKGKVVQITLGRHRKIIRSGGLPFFYFSGYTDHGGFEQRRAERHRYCNGRRKSLKPNYLRIAWPRTVESYLSV